MELNKIYNEDCLETMKRIDDCSVDLIYCDPPYALGSETVVREDGRVDYKKAVDFMLKWDMPAAEFWEVWYKEALRILKYGGHCLMFGMDRQLLLFKYYAAMAGFTEKQSLYWFFISNFPKGRDLSKDIDKYFGEGNGSVVGLVPRPSIDTGYNKTNPSQSLAKKYDGYKYSIAPLKQTNQTIMVFQKPYKTGSCLHDTLALENGDETITCAALDIERGRVALDIERGRVETTAEDLQNNGFFRKAPNVPKFSGNVSSKSTTISYQYKPNEDGRYPSQTFIDSGAGKVLDKQSLLDSGGSSRILHTCDYEDGDYDIYNYCPIVSPAERNEGCGSIIKTNMDYAGRTGVCNSKISPDGTERKEKLHHNNHPTVKPVKLNRKILSLFKTPNKQVVFNPFSGSGSEIIAIIKTGMDYIGSEISAEYCEIANKRIEHGTQQLNIFS